MRHCLQALVASPALRERPARWVSQVQGLSCFCFKHVVVSSLRVSKLLSSWASRSQCAACAGASGFTGVTGDTGQTGVTGARTFLLRLQAVVVSSLRVSKLLSSWATRSHCVTACRR